MGDLALHSAMYARLETKKRTGFPHSLTDGYATLIGPSKGETAVHGCHCPRDMAVRMREVMARPWVGVCVPLALSLHYFQCNGIKFNYFSSITVFHDISKQIQQRARIEALRG